ncbi:MAG TPA: hypothetical protein VFA48_04550 [Gammaproteobacteria bacterium]|nr:hypothetical protein [Gammaproteobacteria bacterium]
MHRSGTSALTGVLSKRGVPLGSKLYEGHAGINDKGYFENARLTDLDDDLLLALGSCWQDFLELPPKWWQQPELDAFRRGMVSALSREFKDCDLWAIKDPRLCRLLPWWQSLLRECGWNAVYALLIRQPLEVAASLKRRDGFSTKRGVLLWVDYTLRSVSGTQGCARTLLTFDELMTDPVAASSKVLKFVDPRWRPSLDNCNTDSLAGFLDQGLRHHRGKDTASDNEQQEDALIAGANELYDRLKNWNLGSAPALEDNELDDWLLWRSRMVAGNGEVLCEQLQEMMRAYGAAELARRRMYRAVSWKMGKPVRFAGRLFNRAIGR